MRKLKRKNPRIKSEDAGGIDKTATPYNPLRERAEKGIPREALFLRQGRDSLDKDPEEKTVSPHPSSDIIVILNSQRILDGIPVEIVEFHNETGITQTFYDIANDPIEIWPGETKQWVRHIRKNRGL